MINNPIPVSKSLELSREIFKLEEAGASKKILNEVFEKMGKMALKEKIFI